MKAKIQETQGDDFNKDSLNVIYQGKVGANAVQLPWRLLTCCWTQSQASVPCSQTLCSLSGSTVGFIEHGPGLPAAADP